MLFSVYEKSFNTHWRGGKNDYDMKIEEAAKDLSRNTKSYREKIKELKKKDVSIEAITENRFTIQILLL